MPMKRILTLAVVLTSVAAAIPAEAQQYAARQQRRHRPARGSEKSDDGVHHHVGRHDRLRDEGEGTERPSRPVASIDEFRAKPAGLPGIPLLAPWANRLDEQAFYANGKRYPFDMELGNVNGAIPIHGFMTRTDQWQVVEAKADGKAAWVTSRLDTYKQPAWMKQWPFAHTIDVTYRLQDGTLEVLTKVTNHAIEPMPVSLGWHPYYQLTDSPREEWTVSIPARAWWRLDYRKVPTGVVEPVEKIFPGGKGALKDYNLDDVFSDLVARCAGTRDGGAEGTQAAARDQPGTELQIAGHLLAESAEHRPRQPDRAAESECAAGGARRTRAAGAAEADAAPAGPLNSPNFICFEPMAGITNALNLAHKGAYKELQYIKPGGTWQESFWIKPSGF